MPYINASNRGPAVVNRLSPARPPLQSTAGCVELVPVAGQNIACILIALRSLLLVPWLPPAGTHGIAKWAISYLPHVHASKGDRCTGAVSHITRSKNSQWILHVHTRRAAILPSPLQQRCPFLHPYLLL
ncbi:hypothetical protein BaRGS_00016423, partial [Batillaria attramentaria]